MNTTADRGSNSRPSATLDLRVGDLVEVKSQAEVLATLNQNGALDALPFMPEMLRFCGQRFRVIRTAHKTCDTIDKTGGRRMLDTVHLEGLRCDGEAHGGCQAGCLFFWKVAWLKRVDDNRPPGPGSATPPTHGGCDLEALLASTRVTSADREERFVCQTTELLRATTPLHWWDVRQYVWDLRSGNVGPLEVARGLVVSAISTILHHVRNLPGGYRLIRLVTRRGRGLWQIPRVEGRILSGPTPRGTLGLKAGDRVRVKSQRAIEDTLNQTAKNRGLWFDAEMLKYCGEEFTVLRRVERIIEEKTGRMLHLPNDCIMLEDVVCCGHFTEKRLFCPRMMPQYWREAWLERVR